MTDYEKTSYEVKIGIALWKPEGGLSTLKSGFVLRSEWLENWRSHAPVSASDREDFINNATAEEIISSLAEPMLAGRQRTDDALAEELLSWAATFVLVSEQYGETIRNLPVWPAEITLVIRNIKLPTFDYTIITEGLDDYVAKARATKTAQVTMLDFDERGNATDLTTVDIDADGNCTVVDGSHRNRIKWLH